MIQGSPFAAFLNTLVDPSFELKLLLALIYLFPIAAGLSMYILWRKERADNHLVAASVAALAWAFFGGMTLLALSEIGSFTNQTAKPLEVGLFIAVTVKWLLTLIRTRLRPFWLHAPVLVLAALALWQARAFW